MLLLVRGAASGAISHGGERSAPATPADMAAAAGQAGIAAFLAEQALLALLKEHNLPAEDPCGAPMLPYSCCSRKL